MIFPGLKGTSCGHLDLEKCTHQLVVGGHYADSGKESIFIDPNVCQKVVDDFHQLYDLSYSYDCWLGNRRKLWRGSYLEEEAKFIHLGMDWNAPVGERVAIDRAATVVRIDNDSPEKHGWGSRVIFELADEPLMLLYAHIYPAPIVHVGVKLYPGMIFATIAPPAHNGGWYAHVHVQVIRKEHYLDLLKNDLRDLDGYGSSKQLRILARNFPDPMRFIRLD